MNSDFKIQMDGMLKGVLAMQQEVMSNVKRTFDNMSKEDGEKFAAALKSADVEKKVRENMDAIIELNKDKC